MLSIKCKNISADPKSVLLGLREKSMGLSKAQTRIPWREIITGLEPDEWSNDACRGYVIMAMEDCGFSKKDIRRVVGQLYEVFDLNSVEDAKEKYLSSPY